MREQTAHLYQEIAETVRRRIAGGELAPGARLPAVREMAQRWNCTPGTVSRAYGVLADEGLVTTHRGGGTRVAENPLVEERPFLHYAALINRAEQLLLEALGNGHTPAQVQAALSVAIARWQTVNQTAVPPADTPPQTAFRFAGSHDLTIDLLARQLHETRPTAQLTTNFTGSLGGLMALARGEAELAGIHLWDAATGQYNLPFVRRVLPGQRVALVTLAHRSLGLMLSAQDTPPVQALPDLAQPGVRWVNRQAGSGTRVWLDAHLSAEQISPGAIAGYEREVPTHMAVAQAVSGGEANAGLGIYAAAAAYGLAFVPLTQELYQLVVPEAVWETAVWHTLHTIIRSAAFQEAVQNLGGYDTAVAGDVVWV